MAVESSNSSLPTAEPPINNSENRIQVDGMQVQKPANDNYVTNTQRNLFELGNHLAEWSDDVTTEQVGGWGGRHGAESLAHRTTTPSNDETTACCRPTRFGAVAGGLLGSGGCTAGLAVAGILAVTGITLCPVILGIIAAGGIGAGIGYLIGRRLERKSPENRVQANNSVPNCQPGPQNLRPGRHIPGRSQSGLPLPPPPARTDSKGSPAVQAEIPNASRSGSEYSSAASDRGDSPLASHKSTVDFAASQPDAVNRQRKNGDDTDEPVVDDGNQSNGCDTSNGTDLPDPEIVAQSLRQNPHKQMELDQLVATFPSNPEEVTGLKLHDEQGSEKLNQIHDELAKKGRTFRKEAKFANELGAEHLITDSGELDVSFSSLPAEVLNQVREIEKTHGWEYAPSVSNESRQSISSGVTDGSTPELKPIPMFQEQGKTEQAKVVREEDAPDPPETSLSSLSSGASAAAAVASQEITSPSGNLVNEDTESADQTAKNGSNDNTAESLESKDAGTVAGDDSNTGVPEIDLFEALARLNEAPSGASITVPLSGLRLTKMGDAYVEGDHIALSVPPKGKNGKPTVFHIHPDAENGNLVLIYKNGPFSLLKERMSKAQIAALEAGVSHQKLSKDSFKLTFNLSAKKLMVSKVGRRLRGVKLSKATVTDHGVRFEKGADNPKGGKSVQGRSRSSKKRRK